MGKLTVWQDKWWCVLGWVLITIYNSVSCLSIQAIPHVLTTTAACMFVWTAWDVEGVMPGDIDGKVQGDRCFIKERLGSKEWTRSSTLSHACHWKQSCTACLYRQWQVNPWRARSGHVRNVREFLSFCVVSILTRTPKREKRTDRFVANGLRCKIMYLLFAEEFCWGSNNNSRTQSTFTRRDVPSFQVTCSRLGMEASWCETVETIDSIVVALVHGV